jgi:hypothetical protein
MVVVASIGLDRVPGASGKNIKQPLIEQLRFPPGPRLSGSRLV